MNKYFIIFGIGILIIGAGIAYRVFLLPQKSVPVTTGQVREITITAQKLRWNWDPEVIEADLGDKIIAIIINEDDFDHGFAIDSLGISQRLPANSRIKVEFIVTQEGEFPFYCSVPCGQGIVDGKTRGHFDQIGKFIVKPTLE